MLPSCAWQTRGWPQRTPSYKFMAYIVMAYIVTAYIVMAGSGLAAENAELRAELASLRSQTSKLEKVHTSIHMYTRVSAHMPAHRHSVLRALKCEQACVETCA